MKLSFAFLLFSISMMGQSAFAVNFPDMCSHESYQLRRNYSAVQTCNTDSDCTYVNPSLQEFTAQIGDSMITDDCTYAPPLVVANLNLLQANREKLIHLTERVWVSCEEQMTRFNCLEKSVELKSTSPVCRLGSCNLN